MADLVAKAIIDVGGKLLKALWKVKTTKKEGRKLQELIALVNAVCIDVRVGGGMETTNPTATLAMSTLKDALVEAKMEVDRYLKHNIIIQAVIVDSMTQKLAMLRQDIQVRVGASVQATLDETSMDVKGNGRMLQGVHHKLDLLLLSRSGDGEREQVQRGNTSGTVVVGKQPRVLTEIQLRRRQQEDTALVSEVLSISLGVAAVLLRHLNWAPERVQNEWFKNGDKLRKAVGLPPSGSMEVCTTRDRECNICFRGNRTTISAGCSHYSCKKCWDGYISVEVGKGLQQCLSLRCPDPSCQMPVTQELVDMVVVKVSDRDRYAMFARWSYVDDSGGKIKWCPGPDCGRAIELLGGDAGAKEDVLAVACDLKHSFCWSCGEEPHRPVSCDTARLWLDTISSREDRVLMFTKRCPKCRKTIENGQTTNNVTCSAPCCHRFCWNCLQPLGGSNHTAGCLLYRDFNQRMLQHYDDKQGTQVKEWERERQHMLTTKKEEKRKAMASYHYELWSANQASLQETDVLLKSSELSTMASDLGIHVADLNFLSQAHNEIAECRRLIRWVYPYGHYHLDPKRDQDKCGHFNRLHKEANDSLECLQDLAVRERFKLYENQFIQGHDVDIKAFEEAYTAFKTKVTDITTGTRHEVEKLVKAVETDFQD